MSSAGAAAVSMRSPWVQLRSVRYHPLIFRKMIGAIDEAARPGDVVNIYDRSGVLLGRGLFNPRSQIVLRVLAWGDRPVDDGYWQTMVGLAVELRRRLRLDEVTDAYRLIHAEGDGLSGVVVERYGDCLVFEIFSLGMFQRVGMLADLLSAELGRPRRLDRPAASASWRVIVRADADIEKAEGFGVPPPAADAIAGRPEVVIREHGVRYRIDLARGQKTGFFCDQRDNRARFAALCRDATVLDLCCYSGGFGLCAKVVGRAAEVTGVDLDEAALAVARDNVNLNNTRIDLVHSDVFIYARQMIANGRQFGAVVLDPPKLAVSRESFDDALRKYYDLNRLAVQLVRPGGLLLTCSCSGLVSWERFIETVHRASRAAGRPLQIFAKTGAGPDHPIAANCPESEYLKVLWTRVLT